MLSSPRRFYRSLAVVAVGTYLFSVLACLGRLDYQEMAQRSLKDNDDGLERTMALYRSLHEDGKAPSAKSNEKEASSNNVEASPKKEETPSNKEEAPVQKKIKIVKKVTSKKPDGTANHAPAKPALDCSPFGGPFTEEATSEMVYWTNHSLIEGGDDKYEGEYITDGSTEEQFLTFEPDTAGFNNKRYILENVLAVAIATNRTLVLPPQIPIHPNYREKLPGMYDFTDFYTLDSGDGVLRIISMKEFLEKQLLPRPPPDNRTDWNGIKRDQQGSLYEYLTYAASSPVWNYDKCVVGLGTNATKLQEMNDYAIKTHPHVTWPTTPMPVDAPADLRLRHMLGPRNQTCAITPEQLRSKVLHIQSNSYNNNRLLDPFYAMIFVEDWKLDLYIKRFIRDHVRYVDRIQCAAARVIEAIGDVAAVNAHDKKSRDFYTFHIRRGDFLEYYPFTKASSQQIYDTMKDVVPDNATVYVATDERNKDFFADMATRWRLLFLDDFKHLVGRDLSSAMYGMIDQRIASRGKVFTGVYYSTFTGYINRMRGYHVQSEGRANGSTMNSYYYMPKFLKYEDAQYRQVRYPVWAREWPLGYVDIDHDVNFVEEVEEEETTTQEIQ